MALEMERLLHFEAPKTGFDECKSGLTGPTAGFKTSLADVMCLNYGVMEVYVGPNLYQVIDLRGEKGQEPVSCMQVSREPAHSHVFPTST
jgi:hypothetical protein